jgi:arabinogalactan endo-1,4-beta-galactosidase
MNLSLSFKISFLFSMLFITSKVFAVEKITLGADISWITEMEAKGMQWQDHAGNRVEPYPWLKSQGLSALRFRIWVDAHGQYNGIEDVIEKAKRAEQAGFKWMLDYHLSDYWADPGKQAIPKSWQDHSVEGLKRSLAKHVTESLTALTNAGVSPDWVQVGNEVNHGFLWPVAHTERNKLNFIDLYQHTANLVQQQLPDAKLILHIADCSEIHPYYILLPPLLKMNAPVDIIGVSAYAYWSKEKTFKQYHQQCTENLNKLIVTFNREVMVVEFGAQWFAANSTLLTQNFYQAMREVNQEELAVFYWEPLASPGMNYPLGAFSPAGSPMPLWDAFVNPSINKVH